MSEFLTSHAVTVANLLTTANVLFKIPAMQRRYVWTPDQIEELMKDVYDSFTNKESHYFIGGMVLAEEKDEERLLVIDGQQRLTTLMLILTAARDAFRGNPTTDEHASYYGNLLSVKRLDKTGLPKPTYLLDLQGSDKEVFYKLLENADLGNQKLTDSTKNLLKAKEVIDEFIRDITDLPQYMSYFLNNVHVVKTVAADASTAFTIFEKLNGTGSSLQAEDLLKNLLLQKVNTGHFEPFSSDWQTFLQKLMDKQGRYVVQVSSFLKHYIMSQGDYVNKIRIYEWFKAHSPNNSDDAKHRLADLDTSAETYRAYVEGKGDSSIKAMKQLGFRQGYVVLLGSQNLLPSDRSKIAKALETVAFCYVITGKKTNDLERRFCDIAALARRAENDENQTEKVQEVLDELKKLSDEMKDQVRFALTHFQYRQRGDKNKTLYLLSRLASALDGSDYSTYTIEHILPKNTDGALDSQRLIPMLGNLTLLHTSDNSSLQDNTFQEKRDVYKNSPCRFTRSLAETLQTGTKNTTFDKAISSFNYFPPDSEEGWTEKQIKERTACLINLAMYVWFT